MSKISVRVDYDVGAFATSPSGRDIVLASKSGLFVLDLQEPLSPPRWLPMRTLWEVADVQWCPHPNHPTWVVSTSNQKLVMWNLALGSSDSIEHIMHGHRRAVTDINFNQIRPDIMASCSIDTYVHLWDLRDPVRPSLSFADFDAGASQVKWCRSHPHLLASAHDNRLVLWDDRKNNVPLYNFPAHVGRINGIDFDHGRQGNIMTCSTDCRVRLWNINELETKAPKFTIKFGETPLWRARFLPTGVGALLVPLRGNNSAHLINVADAIKQGGEQSLHPVRSFDEHTAPIRQLSIRREDNGYDIITWSHDKTLKMWAIDDDSLNKVRVPHTLPPIPRRDISYHDPPAEKRLRGGQRGFFKLGHGDMFNKHNVEHIDWIAGVRLGADPSQPPLPQFASDGRLEGGVADTIADAQDAPAQNLSKEITAVSSKFPKVRFENIDVYSGVAVVSLRGPWGPDEELLVLRVQLSFPSEYPAAPVKSQVEEDPNIAPGTLAEIDDFLQRSAADLAREGQPALEYILRYLMGEKVPIETVTAQGQDFEADTETFSHFADIYDSTDDEYGLRNDVDVSDDSLDDTDPRPAQFIGDISAKPLLDSTPLPKNSGAVWTRDGRLLCFFNSQKSKNTESELPALDRLFAGLSESDSEIYETDSDDFDSGVKYGRNWSFAPEKFTTRSGGGGTRSSDHPLSNQGTAEDLKSQNSHEDAKNMVILYDFNHIMPNRADIAKEYWIDLQHTATEMCAHNEEVALKYGQAEIAYFWKMIHEYVQMTDNFEPSKDIEEPRLKKDGKYVFDWTGHPMQSKLSFAMLDYLEKTYNVQMLASLACAISKSVRPYVTRARKNWRDLSTGKTLPYVPYISETYIVSSDHVEPLTGLHAPLLNGLGAHAQYKNLEAIPVPADGRTAPGEFGAYSSGHPSLGSSPTALPFRHNSSAMSTPNEQPGSSYVSDTDIAALLQERKLPAVQAHLPPIGSLPGNGAIGSAFDRMLASRADHNSEDHTRDHAVNVQIMNPVNYDREFLDEDLGVSVDLLLNAQAMMQRMNHHRNVYARMLQDWGLNIQRLEILKYNFSGDYEGDSLGHPEAFGEQSLVAFSYAELDKTHGEFRELAWDTRRQACALCVELIKGRYFLCTNCNHMMHSRCANTWWDQARECATGCGCKCGNFI